MNAAVALPSPAPRRTLRIAQLAPLAESVPPARYGGTERVVSVLTEALVRRGHEVSLFASGDSVTSARLVPIVPRALRSEPACTIHLPYLIVQLEKAIRCGRDFDIIHCHEPFLNYIAAAHCLPPNVTTVHGRLDLPDFVVLQKEFRSLPLVSISYSQRKPMPWANWVDNVYHGYDPAAFRYSPEPSRNLLFIGRIAPEKRPDRAIEIAIAAGLPLKIAAKVDKADQVYFEHTIRPLLAHPLIEYVGEVNDAEKQALMGDALGVLLPIGWPEPFGLTIIEAMACGTPTIAFNAGSVPELIRHGENGFIVNDVEEAVAAVSLLSTLDRRSIRTDFETRFSADRMVDQYCAIYEALIDRERAALPA
jgi:glycosyltransferase involved in cell wall biosynthesis